MKFRIPVRHLLAVAPHAGKTDVRYYLNGVRIEFLNGKVFCVGTNGKTLAAMLGGEAIGMPDDCSVAGFVIPNDVIKCIKPTGRDLRVACVEIERLKPADAEGRSTQFSWTISYDSQVITFIEIGGNYPDWRYAANVQPSGAPANYDPNDVLLFSKSQKMLGFTKSTRIAIVQNGDKAGGLVKIVGEPDFTGAIYPIKFPAPIESTPPTWLADRRVESKTAKAA